MREATLNEPILEVLGRVRQIAASQGWLLSAGGQPAAPEMPMTFRRGFGSFAPSNGLVVQLAALDAQRTEVAVTYWRGNTPGEDFETDRLLQALLALPQ